MKLYGIPNCGSVKKALDFVNASGIEYEFVDFKKQKPTLAQVEAWAKSVGIDKLFNTKGTKYKSSGLDYKAMSDKERIEALAAEPTMIKRPVIEHKGKVVVGFDEVTYKKELV
ncbi:MAG: Spx/MgsR family RNA polymerase-binding regulatory protein [Campylobacterales bacterium]|nr:Spx/MgsR family RNA polymerase-binding regulatory protein [Campylobacterales bacterium]